MKLQNSEREIQIKQNADKCQTERARGKQHVWTKYQVGNGALQEHVSFSPFPPSFLKLRRLLNNGAWS